MKKKKHKRKKKQQNKTLRIVGSGEKDVKDRKEFNGGIKEQSKTNEYRLRTEKRK